MILLPWTPSWAGDEPPPGITLEGITAPFLKISLHWPLLSIPGLWLGVAVGLARTSQPLRSPQLGVNSTLS